MNIDNIKDRKRLGTTPTRVFLLLTATLFFSASHAASLVIDADTVYTGDDSGTLQNARVVVENGRITAVGSADEIQAPDDAQRLSAAVLTPGLIDARTTVGLSGAYNVRADQDQDEVTGPNTAHLRALDGFNPSETMLDFVRGYGVTTVRTGPGDLNPIAGQMAVFKTAGRLTESMALRPVAGMVFNLGERPKTTYGSRQQMPQTRMAVAAMIRTALAQTQAKISGADNEGAESEGKTPPPDLKVDALIPVLEGDMPAVFIAHRSDDIDTALRLAEEFGLDAQIAYATEAYLMRERLADAGVPLLVGPAMQRLDGLQTNNASLENAALLHDAGIRFAFSTGHEAYVPKNRVLLFELGVAVANGLPAEAAVQAATLTAAELLGVDDRVGSITVGKDADLVLYNGDPFEYTTHVTRVIIDGVVVEDTPR